MTIINSTNRNIALIAAEETENPFILWDNYATRVGTTTSGTATLTDGVRENAFTGTTYDYWLPNVGGTSAALNIKLAAAESLNCFGIAAHNLADLGSGVRVLYSVDGGVSWIATNMPGSHFPVDNSPIIFRTQTTGISTADWRIQVDGLVAGASLAVGVLYFGKDLIFPRRFFRDFSPVLSPTEVQLQSNISVGGNLLGNSVIARGSTISAQFRNLSSTFVRDSMLPFIPHFNAGKGFFFGWRPTTYPQDAHYCWREGSVLRPVNAGPRDLMGVEMQMRAYEA